MASEVPVIATQAGGLPEVVAEGQCGYLLPVGDVDAMASRAIEILSDAELERRLGHNGRLIAERKFNVAKIVPMYRSFYERAMARVTARS